MTDPRRVLGAAADPGSPPDLDLDAVRRRTGQLRRSRRAVLALTGSVVLLIAAGAVAVAQDGSRDSQRLVPPVATAGPSTPPPPVPSAGARTSPRATAPGNTAPPLAFVANTDRDTGAETGGGLRVVSIRTAPQAGYDRVVYEFAGPDTSLPGWSVEYTDHPARDAGGTPVDVRGSATLQVSLRGVASPTPENPPFSGQLLPTDTALLREVLTTWTFEGESSSLIGVSAKAPFRVFRLAGPTRVVVDIRTD